MGLYAIPCRQCGKPFMWFSGNMDQRCRECVELSKADPADEKWTDDRLLHEGVWLVEHQLYRDASEVEAWAKFVREVWAARETSPPRAGRVDAPIDMACGCRLLSNGSVGVGRGCHIHSGISDEVKQLRAALDGLCAIVHKRGWTGEEVFGALYEAQKAIDGTTDGEPDVVHQCECGEANPDKQAACREHNGERCHS